LSKITRGVLIPLGPKENATLECDKTRELRVLQHKTKRAEESQIVSFAVNFAIIKSLKDNLIEGDFEERGSLLPRMMNEQDRDYPAGRSAQPSTSTRESMEYINASKFTAESMDFEEMETVMWRKV